MKKGQSGATSITVLLILLALFIVLYVLLLPPEDREALLYPNGTNIDNSNNINGIDSQTGGKILLYEVPGTLTTTTNDLITHNLDPVDLFIKEEPQIIKLSNSMQIERSDFSNQDQSLTFNIDKLSNIKTALLTFTVTDSSGQLIIELNGQKIYQNTVRKGQQETVNIRIDLLNAQNELKFSVSSPGILFFLNNKYSLKDIIFKQQLETINSKEDRTFYISNNEKNNIDRSTLSFNSYCNSLDESATSLNVYLNNKILTSEVISCGSGERGVDIDINKLLEGQNMMTFVISSGAFQISNIELTNNLKQGIYQIYEFDLTNSELKAVEGQDKRVVIRIGFDDKTSTKSGRILVNEDQFSLDTTSNSYAKDISDAVTDGVNKIRIVPSRDMNVSAFKIVLEDAN